MTPVHQIEARPVDGLVADAAFFNYCLAAQAQVGAYSQQWTAFKNAARSGAAPTLGPAPVAPNLGTAPAAVAPGIYRQGDDRVGQWSDVVSIPVAG